MVRHLVLALVGCVALAAPTSARAQSPLVSQDDPAGDVTVVDHSSGASPTQRGSVDLRHLTVTPETIGVRFSIRLRSVLGKGAYVQRLGVAGAAAKHAKEPWTLTVTAVPQRPGRATAVYVDPSRPDLTRTCDATVSSGPRKVRIDVPGACVPADPGTLRVLSILTAKHHPGHVVSKDVLRVPGTPDLGRR
jgi:hypothetical protein